MEFSGCGNVEHGGAIHVGRANNILIKGCHFVDNHVLGYSFKGGAIYTNQLEIMIIKDSVFDNNSAARGVGGAISVNGSSIFSNNNRYINNSARRGGAIFVKQPGYNISTTNDEYINNCAGDSGGAIFVSSGGSVLSTGDHYISNIAESAGGAIFAEESGFISTTNDQYINNSAYDGGAIFAEESSYIYTTNDRYINNSAQPGNGGAIVVSSNGNIVSTGDHYIQNSAKNGGAIFGAVANISITNDRYINNSADAGGAIYAKFVNTMSSTNNHFIDNSADCGGAIYIKSSTCSDCDDTKISGDNFEGNSAVEGAVIYKTKGTLEISQSYITSNAGNRSVLYMNSVPLSIFDGVNFINNQGSLYVISTQVQLKGTVTFRNNIGNSGGAITAILSQISFNKASTITICNNTASSGGGISLIQSSLHVYDIMELTENKATNFGGGIYAYQSDIEFKPEQTWRSEISISKNTASNGGAICAITSKIQIKNVNTHIDLTSNRAEVNGGGIYLEQNSKIYIRKNEPEFFNELNVQLHFIDNRAEKGGAIYVADSTNVGVLCQGGDT